MRIYVAVTTAWPELDAELVRLDHVWADKAPAEAFLAERKGRQEDMFEFNGSLVRARCRFSVHEVDAQGVTDAVYLIVNTARQTQGDMVFVRLDWAGGTVEAAEKAYGSQPVVGVATLPSEYGPVECVTTRTLHKLPLER